MSTGKLSSVAATYKKPSLSDSDANSNAADQAQQSVFQKLANSKTTSESIANQPTTTEKILNSGWHASPTEAVEAEATPEPIELKPWETRPLSSRINDLMKTEGLSRDAATVIVMTERNTNPVDPDSAPTIDENWRAEFAEMVSRSGDEIATWAESQETGAITFVPGDNDIRVSQRNDGMLVIESSLNGTVQNTQVVDPSATDRIVINAGSGDDQIFIDDSVSANLLLAGGDGQDFIFGGGGNDIILGGDGADLIRAGAGSDIVIGGNGDDNIEGQSGGDILIGQQGDDYLSGDKGNDILLGSEGEDTVYGGENEDILMGQTGNDYLDAGQGDDLAVGGSGDDFLSGGKGSDELRGNLGADTLVGASGADTYRGLDNSDTLFADSQAAADSLSTRVPGADVKFVDVDHDAGSSAVHIASNQRDEFVTRVEDDLETLRSVESGQTMLTALDQAKADSYRSDNYLFGLINIGGGFRGNQVNIQELDGANHINFLRGASGGSSTENGFASWKSGTDWRSTDPVNNPRPGGDSTISYNPSVNLKLNTGVATPPVVILFHEMAHAYNITSGTGLAGTYNGVDTNDVGDPNVERQAVGLTVDHDGDPTTPEQLISSDVHPFEMTENGIREELGLAQRPFY